MPESEFSAGGVACPSSRLEYQTRAGQHQTGEDAGSGVRNETIRPTKLPPSPLTLPSWRVRRDAPSRNPSPDVSATERDENDSACREPSRRSLFSFRIRSDRQPPPDTSPSVAEAAPDEAAKFGTTRSGAPTAQKSWTGRRVFRTNFFSSLVSSNKVARSRAAEERLVGAQQVADSQVRPLPLPSLAAG